MIRSVIQTLWDKNSIQSQPELLSRSLEEQVIREEMWGRGTFRLLGAGRQGRETERWEAGTSQSAKEGRVKFKL